MCRILSVMIICPLRGINTTNISNPPANSIDDSVVVTTPFAVSIVTSACQQPRNMVRVVDLRQRSSSRGSKIKYAAEFSVCVPPIFGNFDDLPGLVEFVEVNRVLGADKFQFYVDSVGRRVDACLQEYARNGIVELQPWSLPPDVARVIFYHGQILAMNECLYRLMYRTKYVIVQDLDEFVVPMRSDSWLSMLKHINNDTFINSDGIASYSFRNRWFATEILKASSLTSVNSSKHRLKTLTAVQADEKLFPHDTRSKVMARPERIIIWHVHLILNSSLVLDGGINFAVHEKYGQLFHYRQGITIDNTTTVSRMREFEEEIIGHIHVATAAKCLTGDNLHQ